MGCVTVGFVGIVGVLVWWQLTDPGRTPTRGGPMVSVSRPVGLQLETINASNAARLGIDRGWGWYVGEVDAGSPAALAGIRRGDFLLTADDKWLSQLAAGDPLFVAKDGKPSGSRMRLWGYRDLGSSLQQWTWQVSLP